MSGKSRTSNTESSKEDADRGMVSSTNRRQLLVGLAGGFGLLAGCSGFTVDVEPDTDSQPSPTADPSTTDDPTATSTSTATEDETPTQQTTTASGPELTTYKNERSDYRIQYPTAWSTKEETKLVRFVSDSENSALAVEVVDDIGQRDTLSRYVDFAVANTRVKRDDFKILNERDTTLSSGQPAYIAELRFSWNETGEPMRGTGLIALHEERAYEVEFVYRNANYTETAEQLAASTIDSFAFTE